jgi:hypothetical protein
LVPDDRTLQQSSDPLFGDTWAFSAADPKSREGIFLRVKWHGAVGKAQHLVGLYREGTARLNTRYVAGMAASAPAGRSGDGRSWDTDSATATPRSGRASWPSLDLQPESH